MIEAIVTLLIAAISFICGIYISETYNQRIFAVYSYYMRKQAIDRELHNEKTGYQYNPLNDAFMGHLKAHKRATVLMNHTKRV